MPIKGLLINRLLVAGAGLLFAGGVLAACQAGEGGATVPAAPGASAATTAAKPLSASTSPSAPVAPTKTATIEQQTGEATSASRPAGGGQAASGTGVTSDDTTGAQQPQLFLTVTEPANESVSNEERITFAGNTAPGAVVSVDDHAITVDAAGNFRTTVPLEEGANDIDIVASDSEGNEKYETLEVIYAP